MATTDGDAPPPPAVPLDPRRLLTFRSVAHEGSFSAAARARSLTQPAVSQQVAALETQLGLRLLHRDPGGLRLTAAGEVALAHADAIADRLQLAGAQLAELAATERVRLRVGAFPSALATIVPEAIARLGSLYPGAEVAAEEGADEALTARVADGRLHLAIAFQDAAAERREPDGLTRHDLAREPFLLALAPGHRLAAGLTTGTGAAPAETGPPVRLTELADDPWTAPSTEHIVANACREAGFEPRIVSIARDPLAIRSLVSLGLAVALIPRSLAVAMHGIALRELAPPSPQRDVYALTPASGAHPLAASFVDAVAAAVAA